MALEADALNLNAVRLHEINDAAGAGSLVAVVLQVVVIVVELSLRVYLGRVGKGDRDVGFTNRVVEDRLAVGAILIER